MVLVTLVYAILLHCQSYEGIVHAVMYSTEYLVVIIHDYITGVCVCVYYTILSVNPLECNFFTC